MRTTSQRWLAATVLAVSCLVSSGCAARYVDYMAFARTPDVVLAHARYRIAPPDELRVHSRLVREVDGERVTVRTDGTIVLPLLGEIQAAGRTRFELAAALTRRADEYYINPHVDVRVERHASQHVFVRGCVTQPGAQPYDGRNTALTALARAEPTTAGDPTRILVLKPTGDGRYRRRATINLDALTHDGNRSRDVVLQPGEIVHVPRHPLAPRHTQIPREPVTPEDRVTAFAPLESGEQGAPHP